jgi:hypothetical protein
MPLPRGKIGLVQNGLDYRLNVCKLVSDRQLAKIFGIWWRYHNSAFNSTYFMWNIFII